MIKRSFALLTLSLIVVSVFSQDVNFKKLRKAKIHRCYTVEVQNNYLKAHPNAETPMQFEGWLQGKITERKAALAAKGKMGIFGTITPYTLPIVFHIIHNGEAIGKGANVDSNFIKAQLLQLNKDYANLSGSPYSVASTTGIQFGLATKDPSGKTLAEPGIDRINRKTKKWGAAPFDYSTSITDTIKPATIWDPYRYINVWLVEEIADEYGGGILGIATLPTSSVLDGLNLDTPESDSDAGVVITSSAAGSMFSYSGCGSSVNPYTHGRTLTHELGHFFGLRHIWGDELCSTDFCDDTPIHYDQNFGKPNHPKPNSCGTKDEMFEDYMDYTDDDVMNTFTANQADRIQTVMLNSPRRMTLATSNVPTIIPSIGSNKLTFAICNGVLEVAEKGKTGSINLYKDIKIVLNVEKVATANATVTIQTAGSAKRGIDYELIGDTLDFAANNGAKSFILRILDNNAIDGDRTVVLSYQISGTGVTAGDNAQSLSVIIKDDDSKIIGNKSIVLLNENFGTTGGNIPKGWTTIESSGCPNYFVVSNTNNSIGTGQWAHVTNSNRKTQTYTKSENDDYLSILSTPMLNGNGYKSINPLKFKYKAGGISDDSTGEYAAGTVNYTLNEPLTDSSSISNYNDSVGLMGSGPYYQSSNSPSLVSPEAFTSSNFYVHFMWESYYTKTGKNPGLCLDDVTLDASPFPIDSTVSKSYSLIIPANTTNLIRSNNEDIIASVAGASAPFKNFVASITEAGTSQVDFLVGSKTYQRSKKVINFDNGTTDNTSAFTTTLYYNTNEIAAWSNTLQSIRVLQLNNGTTFSSGTISPTTATILTPTSISDKRATDGYVAITISSKGLGSFALIDNSVSLPISWKYVTGKVQNNSAVIAWQLLTPTHGIKYSVERSEDGIRYSTVQSALTGTTLTDATIDAGKNYFYRVIASTPEGKVVYSSVINVIYFSLNHSFTVAPNPFSNVITIQNNGTASGNTSLSVFDVTGRLVFSKSFASQATTSTINTASWISGVYLVKIKSAESAITYKLIKR